ncbi:TolC family protein [Bacteroides sp. 224]|uniref:TolC family protein n=1 Tax=Bacteroides sp. 224 TaxID=2302936 RepID=UPI0013CFCFAD|nr:TolC family protein [Bacteroides sp. 224]NDV64629.1 TolC family protein [Bacteroides sp. 224]
MNKIRTALVVCLLNGPTLLWSQEFKIHKLNIEEMFELAETNSKSILTFDIAEKEAAQAIKVAKTTLLPDINLSLSASFLGNGRIMDRDFSNGMDAPMPHFGNNFSIEASQVLYAGGAISGEISMTKVRHQLAQLEKDKNRQDIRFLLTGNYLELYKLNNQQEVYLKNLEQTQKLLSDIKAKQKEGLALQNDITRYELQLKSLELALTQVRNTQIILNNQLVTVLGLPEETIIEVDTCFLKELPNLSSEVYWQQTAIETSPILQQAQLGIKQAGYNEKVVKAEKRPSLALFAGNYLDGPITIEIPTINKNFNYWYVGLGIKYNLASLYKTGKKNRLAKLSTQKAAENELLTQEHLQTEVKACYVRFMESFMIHDTQLKSLELAVRNYHVINKRYLNDLALITDMLDASNSKLNAELQLVNAKINIIFNYYKLKKAAGNL